MHTPTPEGAVVTVTGVEKQMEEAVLMLEESEHQDVDTYNKGVG